MWFPVLLILFCFSASSRPHIRAHAAGEIDDDLPLQAVFTSLRRRAGNGKKLKCGAVTFIQRFGDALNLNCHYHLLAIDGAYALDKKERFISSL
jgi:hypothetical protein